MPELPDVDALAAELVRLLDVRLVDPLEILLDGGPGVAAVRREVVRKARRWATTLLSGDERGARYTATRLVGTLYPGNEPFAPPPDWWATPLGRVVAHRVGHPGATAVSYPVAGAMLGITRQGVHDLVHRGKLARHPDGGVTVDSVRARLDAGRTHP